MMMIFRGCTAQELRYLRLSPRISNHGAWAQTSLSASTGGRVPILAVATGCEDRDHGSDLDSWLSDVTNDRTNKDLLQRVGITPDDFACTTFVSEKSRLFDQNDYDNSVSITLKKIQKVSAGDPIILCGQSYSEIAKFIYRNVNNVLNKLISIFSFSIPTPKVALGVQRALVDIYRKVGASEEEAVARASEVTLGKKSDDILIKLEEDGFTDEDIQVILSSALATYQQRA